MLSVSLGSREVSDGTEGETGEIPLGGRAKQDEADRVWTICREERRRKRGETRRGIGYSALLLDSPVIFRQSILLEISNNNSSIMIYIYYFPNYSRRRVREGAIAVLLL